MNSADSNRPSGFVSKLPLLLALGVAAFLLLDRVQANTHLFWAIASVASGLVGWFLLLKLSGRAMLVDAVKPVKQHYIQASVQLCLYLYWGYHWQQGDVRPIYAQAPLILAQFFYLYAFDALWSWTRGRAWRFSSGPTPIVLSTNLFIWFHDDWFIWQFAMLSMGLLGKEFIRWNKEGRRTHIFNPSGFGLACAATVLIATDSTDLTWAKPLSTTLQVDHIFLVLFILGLVVQHFFAVTLMTFAAALAMIVGNLAYTEVTGVYLFASSNLPAAAFLGLLLLMTDPSTSPRTNVGRTLFGFGYGIGYIVAFEILGKIGAPELYAKLYPVPILNLTVQILDRFARTGAVGRLNERWERGISPKVSNAIHMSLWSGVFAVMWFTGYVPGLVNTPHPGDSIPFWKQAVAEDRYDAERKLVIVAGTQAVAGNSSAAYNELGILSLTSSVDDKPELTRRKSAADWFSRSADLGDVEGNKNLFMLFLFGSVHRSDADLIRAIELCKQQARDPGDALAGYLLGVASEVGKAMPLDLRAAFAYYQGCPPTYLPAQKGIARLALRRVGAIKLDRVVPLLQAAAEDGDGESCYYLAYMHLTGMGVTKDAAQAQRLTERAAKLGFGPAIEAVKARKLEPFKTPLLKFMAHPAWATSYPTEG